MVRCRTLLFSFAVLLGLAACAPQGGGATTEGGRTTYPLGRKTDSRLREAAGLLQKQQWDKALAELEVDMKDLNPYEQARILRLKAQIRLLANRVDQGVQDLEQAVALNAMPLKEQLETEYLLGQAYLHQERFAQAADTLDKWLAKNTQPTPENYFDVARASARAKRYKAALPNAKKAVELSTKPEEPRLALLAWVHSELRQHAEAAAVAEKLVQAFPKKEHWLQLSQTYLDVKDHRKAMETLEVPYTKGLLTDDAELVTMARLYLKGGEPRKGAELLEKQMGAGKVEKTPQNNELLAQCFIQAGDTDRGTATLELVGKQVSSGQVYLELGRAHVLKSAWEPARDALAQAVITGGMRFPGSAQLLLAITHYKLKRKDAALASLARAKQYPSATKCAEAWVSAIKKNKKDTEEECAVGALAVKDPPQVTPAKPPAAGTAAAKQPAAPSAKKAK